MMPSPDKIETSRNGQELLNKSEIVVLIIDDEIPWRRHLKRQFNRLTGFLTIAVNVNSSMKATDFARELTSIKSQLESINGRCVDIVLVDQNFEGEDESFRGFISDFLSQILNDFPTAIILEIGGMASHPVFNDSSGIIQKLSIDNLFDLLEMLPNNPGIRANQLVSLASEEALAAQISGQTILTEKQINDHFRQITKHARFGELCDLVNLNWFSLEKNFNKLSDDNKRKALHYMWNILGVLKQGHDKTDVEKESKSITELRRLLSLETK